ncbi:hypothetical protein PITCH_A140047 [uncultured Desulfobacterium sp.]|uniref:Uncharacterized protein n=1 Tax=uncultured Desulfobacterium sp. TaxID=201089 RepID=A0A445MSW6_9BACT|nr:hypothetical protein PITCH_A140047 [uncultured Desulfobacterium sp.]
MNLINRINGDRLLLQLGFMKERS